MIAALVATLALLAALSGVLFWQLKRASAAMDKLLAKTEESADQRILLAAAEVAVADKEKAMNLLIVERDNLQSAYDTVRTQRNDLLKEAMENATPGSVATSIRDALERLRDLQPEEMPDAEAVPDVPSS